MTKLTPKVHTCENMIGHMIPLQCNYIVCFLEHTMGVIHLMDAKFGDLKRNTSTDRLVKTFVMAISSSQCLCVLNRFLAVILVLSERQNLTTCIPIYNHQVYCNHSHTIIARYVAIF